MSKHPFKINFKTEGFSIFLVLLSFIFSVFFIKFFPDQVAVHWNINGEPDGFNNKYFAALVIPAVILFIYLIFLFLPIIDPEKERYLEFSKIYNYFKSIIIFFMFFVYLVAGFNNLGYNLPIEKIIPVSIGLLFVIIGKYMKKIKMNWFVGIKTPWTLSSENVWDKTHIFSGKIFMISGVLIMLTAIINSKYKLPLFIFVLLLIISSVTIYSYYIYVKEFKNKKRVNRNNQPK